MKPQDMDATIAALRNLRWAVKTYYHRGGLTSVCIQRNDPCEGYMSYSICNPKDTYDKRIGKSIAFGRAYELWKVAQPKTGIHSPEWGKVMTPAECRVFAGMLIRTGTTTQ